MVAFVRTHAWLVAGSCLLFVVVAGTLYVRQSTKSITYESVAVVRGEVKNIVNVSGHVEPVQRIALSFASGGRVASLWVAEGDRVERGAQVASLDHAEESSLLREAQARVAREHAVYEELTAPVRTETRRVQESTLAEARTAALRAEESARSTLAHVFVLADDAVREEADELFVRTSTDPKFGIHFTSGTTDYVLRADSATAVEINKQRAFTSEALSRLEKRATTTGDLGVALDDTDDDLRIIETFLSTLAEAVNRYRADGVEDQGVYESFQTSVASARSAISTARNEVASTHGAYTAAQAAYDRVSHTYTLALADTEDTVLRTQASAVTVAEQSVETARTRVADATLLAPIAGTIAKVLPRVGESVGPYESIVELLTEGTYEVEVYIPEADIADVALGDQAMIVLDAFDANTQFKGEVTRIALSETMREGVPTYKTTISFVELPDASLVLRPGMTADVDIEASVRPDVLFVPVRSVIAEEGRTYIRIVTPEGFVERDVVTGLRGSEGTIEILSGVTEGEEVVLFVEEV